VLFEREHELELLRAMLRHAEAGSGALAFIEAPAGQGKTALLRALRREATDSGVRVLSAIGAELERDFAFGLVRQLFEPELRVADGARRARLFRDAAELARPVVVAGDIAEGVTDASHARLHGLFWLLANLAEEQPALIVVDDAHWGDAPSLRFLDMLARRVEDLPVLMAVAARPDEPEAETQVLDSLASAPGGQLVRPGTLSRAAVGLLVGAHFGEQTADAFVGACFEKTGGNPLLVTELLAALAREGATGMAADLEHVRRAVPATITRTVVMRLRRLAPATLALARALAVLGERNQLTRVAALAGITLDQASEQHAVLARAGLLEREALRFVHPLLLAAVHADLVGGERSLWHRRAARLLADDGAREQEIAVHLLHATPAGESWAARALVNAGRRARCEGAPDVAQRLLARALAEAPAAEDNPQAMLELGLAEAALGGKEALDHLTHAAATGTPLIAARAEQLRGGLLLMSVRPQGAVEALERAVVLLQGADPATVTELKDDLLYARHYAGLALDEQLPLFEQAAREGRVAALAHLAMIEALRGAPANTVVDLANRALADGRLIRDRVDQPPASHAIFALGMVDAAAEAAAAIELATEAARKTGSRYAAACVAGARTFWEHNFGDLRRAEDDARLIIDVFRSTAGPGGADDSGMLALATALLDRGRVSEAERTLADLPADWGPDARNRWLRGASLRARIRLAQGRPEEALSELREHLRDDEQRGRVINARDLIRATLVAALAELGHRDEALALADEHISVARRRGLPTAETRLLVARARAFDGPDRITALEEAVEAARRSPSRLVQAQALGELGATLRRAGNRVAARQPLRHARELAHHCGATGLEATAHDELVIAGARPKRLALSGVDALTASERRVAELAARGMRNREIAETLFVTRKTVETHLGHTYAKLNIQAREQLTDALGSAGLTQAAAQPLPR
jgi:DNA-binding CsgD family transcriptional regulator/predicted negative regulator of RcsB-dependent stress response